MIGERLKELREKNKLTLKALAEKCGVSTNAVWRWEQGKQIPTTVLLERLTNALRTSENFLLGKTDDSSPSPYYLVGGDSGIPFREDEITTKHNIIVPVYDLPKMIERYDRDKDLSIFKAYEIAIPIMWIGKLPEKRHPFFFVVHGDGMAGAGLHEGFLALVNPEEVINNGDIVLALTGPFDEITVRWCYFLPDGSIELRCSSPNPPVLHFYYDNPDGKPRELQTYHQPSSPAYRYEYDKPGGTPMGVKIQGKIVGAWAGSLKRGI
jgi:transcriptional regulator with XRE-family HTH domain